MIPFAFAMLLTTAPLIMPTATKEKTPAAVETPPPLLKTSAAQSYFSIPLKERALDLQQAFDLLKREKTTGKVYFQLVDQTVISNIIEMTLLANSSMILFRYNTNTQGIKIQVVKVEDIEGLSYY
jgi:hypothetical protein